MSTVWEGALLAGRDGHAPTNPESGDQTYMLFVPGATYHVHLTIEQDTAVSKAYSAAWYLNDYQTDGVNPANGTKKVSANGGPMGINSTHDITFSISSTPDVFGIYYSMTLLSSSSTVGHIALGANAYIDPAVHYRIFCGSADQHHGSGLHTPFSWLIEDDAVVVPPPPEPGDVVDVVDDDDVFIDTLVNITDKVIRIERQGWGSGSFRIRRDASDAPLIGTGHDGRMVKVTIPRISSDPIFRWMIENVQTVVADKDEQGEELITVAGRGALAYLDRAVESPYVYVVPSGPTETHGPGPVSTGQKAGQLLRRLIAEFQHVDRPQQPIPLITVDFDYTDDSNGDAWDATPATAEWMVPTGDSALLAIQELWGMSNIDILLKPDGSMLLQGFNSYGRDLTGGAFGAGVVRFVKGVNIADRLTRTRGTQLPTTHLWIEGGDFVFIDPPVDLGTSAPVVEGFLKTAGTDPTTLEAVGTAALTEALRRGESVAFNVAIPYSNDLIDEDAGMYLPGPEGTNGHFWIGDTITISSGSGLPDDFEDEDARIEALTIWFDDANNLLCKVEVKATTILGRLPPTTGSRATFGGPPSVSGAGGTTQPPVPSSSDLHDHEVDTSGAHAASAISFSPTGTVAGTNVQTALAEVASEAIQNSLLTTQDDIIVRGASAPARLGKGSDGQVLTVDPTTHHLVWATPSAGAAITVKDEGTPLATDASSLDFVGAGVTASGTGAAKTITIPGASAITVKDEGTPLATDATSLDFVGAGVVASGATGAKTITVSGSGGPHSGLTGLTSGDDHTQYVENADDNMLNLVFGDGTNVIAVNSHVAFKFPRAGHFRPNAAIIAPDQSGSIVFDIWVRNGALPTVTQTITASAKPTLTTSQFNDAASTMSGWTTAFGAGDWCIVNVDSVTSLKNAILALPIDWT